MLEKFGFLNYLDELRDRQHYGRNPPRCLADRSLHAVSVNKMRGMFSAQIKKWGAYQLRNIDYVMLRTAGKAFGAWEAAAGQQLRMVRVVNADRLQVYSKKTLNKLTEDSSIEEILKLDRAEPFVGGLLPNGRNPSDHEPVVVEFVQLGGEFGSSVLGARNSAGAWSGGGGSGSNGVGFWGSLFGCCVVRQK